MVFQLPPSSTHKKTPSHPRDDKEVSPPSRKKPHNLNAVSNRQSQPEKSPTNDKVDKIYQNRVSFRFPLEQLPQLRNKTASLFARLQHVDAQLSILPNKDFSNCIPISSGPTMPKSTKDFYKYFSDPIHRRKQVEIYLTMQSSKKLSEIKYSPFILEYLKTNRIYMSIHIIQSSNVIPVGWFLNSNPQFHSIDYMMTKLKQLLPDNLQDIYQVKPRLITYAIDKQIQTRAWTLEMDKELATKNIETIFKTLSPSSDLTLVPIDSRGDQSGTICHSFHEQNCFLKENIIIHVDNAFGIDEPLFEKGKSIPTIRETSQFLDPATNKPRFLDVIQFNSNRINFLLNKSNEIDCLETLHQFFIEYLPKIDTDSVSRVLTFGRDPVVHGTRSIPREVELYTKNRKNVTSSFTSSDITNYSTPPPTKKSYASVTKTTNSETKPTNYSTTATTVTNTSPLSEPSSQYTLLLQKINEANERQEKINSKVATDTSQLSTLVTELTKSYEKVQHTMTNIQNQYNNITKELQTFRLLLQTQLQSNPVSIDLPTMNTLQHPHTQEDPSLDDFEMSHSSEESVPPDLDTAQQE